MTNSQTAFWSTPFEDVSVTCNRPILEVTLNRPTRYNALNGQALRELHDIFQCLRKNTALHVAIITVAGDKAFCSDNDLKSTHGGQETMPETSGERCEVER